MPFTLFFVVRMIDSRNDGFANLHRLLDAMYPVRGSATADEFDAASANDALPESLVEIHRLNLEKRDLCHLNAEDTVFLDEAVRRHCKFCAAAEDSANEINTERKDESHTSNDVEKGIHEHGASNKCANSNKNKNEGKKRYHQM